MPVDLDAIPDKAPKIPRPKTRRWLGFWLVCLVIGMLATVWFWQADRSSATFWFTALGVPTFFSGAIFSLRRIGYKSDQVWAASWDAERHRLYQQETARGQRCAWMIDASVVTTLSEGREALIDAVLDNDPLMSSITPRSGKGTLRHTYLQGFEKTQSELLVRLFNTLTSRLAEPMAKLPESMPCMLALQVGADLEPSVIERLWKETSHSLSRQFISLNEPEFHVLDRWLDTYYDIPSALLVVSAQINSAPVEGSGEAIVGTLLVNRPSPEYPDAVFVHRPQLGSPDNLTQTLSRALLWTKSAPEEIKYSWLTGGALALDGLWGMACESNGVVLNMQTQSSSLDIVVGYTGHAAPWLALAAGATHAEQGGMKLVLAVQTSQEHIWVGGVSPAILK
ncbi:hypothetical protein [Xenorhabdus szentirmaii]|uniref:hypothetical protein n=1 Tax=Xenorhabdus szentirmaii TaxID=290112 RepID=UPI0019A71F53|nr:hypothetical protein [Xenorhabdus sp. 38]MBD2781055.1 hypothetical protein [Xenorhabdus sp. 38]